jgi:opacity protein-like surface antigen
MLLLSVGQARAGDSAWYLETRLGSSDLDTTLGSRWPKGFNDQDSSVGVEVGYRIHRYLAVQIGYHDFGDFQGFGAPCSEDDETCILTIAGEPLIVSAAEFALCVEGAPDCHLDALVATPLTAEASGLSLTAVPTWPVNDRLSLYAKLGVLSWGADVSESFDGRRVDHFSDLDALAGIGLRYAFPSGFGVSAEYQRVDLDLGSASLGASWRF